MNDRELSTKDKDPIECSKHLLYEIEMFYYAGKWLCDPTNGDDALLKNAVLESFLIHTRLLYNFFYGNRFKDDVIAEDLLSDGPTEKPPLLEHIQEPINKRVAHLAESRTDVNADDDTWPISKIIESMDSVLGSCTWKAMCEGFVEDVERLMNRSSVSKRDRINPPSAIRMNPHSTTD